MCPGYVSVHLSALPCPPLPPHRDGLQQAARVAGRLMPAGSESLPIRPSFTAIMWGCSMLLWPRILRHIQSKIDGDISVARTHLPPKVTFLCAAPEASSAHPLSPLSAYSADSVYVARARTDHVDTDARNRLNGIGWSTSIRDVMAAHLRKRPML